MNKILLINGIDTRFCTITPLNVIDNNKMKKDYIFYKKHNEDIPIEIKNKCNSKYVFMDKTLTVVDVDSFEGFLDLFIQQINYKETDITNYTALVFKNDEEISTYIQGKLTSYKVDLNEIISKIQNIKLLDEFQIISEEHSIINIIAYSFYFNTTYNCQIDLTFNGLIHLYFKYNKICNHKTVCNNVEILTSSCITISNCEHYKLMYSNSNKLVPFNENLLTYFKHSVDEIISKKKKIIQNKVDKVDEVKVKYINKSISKLDSLDFNKYIEELKSIMVNIFPLEMIDNYHIWFKTVICIQTINIKLNNIYDNELYDLFVQFSTRSDKFKTQDVKVWSTVSNYTIHEKYIYNILREEGLISSSVNDASNRGENMEYEIKELMSIFTFKYFDQIEKLVFRKKDTHYFVVKESVMAKIFFNIFKYNPSLFKNYIQSIIYNITSRVDHVGSIEFESEVCIFDYKDLIPFKDFVFDLNLKTIRTYTDTDYILYDVGYFFPLDLYNNALQDESALNQTCLNAISDMFLTKEEEKQFWICMSENLDRKCKSDAITFLYGAKANGKSSIFKVNSSAFGDLDTPVGATYLQKRKRQSGEPEYYRLLYSFYASIPEAPTDKIDSEVIKTNSSGDRMSFRLLYSNAYIQFSPSYKIIINTNTLPIFTQYDGGVRRRLQVIPFKVKFTKNPKLKYEKKADLTVRQQFQTSTEWRDTYMIKLILSYYQLSNNSTEKMYNEIIKQIDIMNEKFLGYLFEFYEITDDDNPISFDNFYNEYKIYQIDNNATKETHKIPKIMEIFKSFDIIYDPIESQIMNLVRI